VSRITISKQSHVKNAAHPRTKTLVSVSHDAKRGYLLLLCASNSEFDVG